MGETKAYTFKVKPQEDSNIYRLIQIDSGKTLDDLHSAYSGPLIYGRASVYVQQKQEAI